LQYDPDLANRLLDEVGMKRGRNGLRRLPSGGRFRQLLNLYTAESGVSNDLWQLVADYWREVGLDFVVKIDARTLSTMQVRNGNSDFWAYATAGMHWVLEPNWYVPWASGSYFAPLYGRYVYSDGKDKMGVKPTPEWQRLVHWYLELRATMDEERRLELGRRILGQWADECYTIGICRREAVTIVTNHFKNAPDHIVHSWRVLTPGYIGIEQFYIDDEEVAGP
jgi:peptide/nickel transport system substrate-binding protein